MSRLIDADALKETIASNVYPVSDYFNSRDYGMFWTGGIEKAIDEQPTIEERKTGAWIREDKHYKDSEQEFYYYEERCSECGANRKIGWGEVIYCPNCGAKMEG